MNREQHNRFEVPCRIAVCPECDASLELRVLEYEIDNGRPTEGGCLVVCSAEDEELECNEFEHHYGGGMWDSPQWKVTDWATRNVCVYDATSNDVVRSNHANQNEKAAS